MSKKNTNKLIGVNNFAKRQTPESEFTHFSGTFEELSVLTKAHFNQRKPGYREGVCLVPLPERVSNFFYCGIISLQPGDKLVGEFKARREGEEPRKTLRLKQSKRSQKAPCKAVDVILYSREILEENGEDCTGADWDIISINGRLTFDEMPIHPDTLIANHFQLDGGTATNMTPKKFETALKESVLFWKDKAMLESTKE